MEFVQGFTALAQAGNGEADDIFVSAPCESDMEPGACKDSNAHLAAGTPPDLSGFCLHVDAHEASIENGMLRRRHADDTQTIREIIWKECP
jgi:hypothetical protein